ncbi:MAG: hypothetical protein ACKVOE_09550 [Rickettsiales bacterium]
MAQLPAPYTEPYDADAMSRLLEEQMDAIMQLLEAIRMEDPNADMKLAELLEGKPDQLRRAIIEKLRALLRGLANEKENELDKFVEADKRQQVERERNIFLQWLTWIMSEETLRKIREAFLASPRMQQQVLDIGQALANFGVQQQLREQMMDKRELGALSANVNQGQGEQRGKDDGKGRT